MWARYVIETRGWDSEVANWSFNAGNAFDPGLTIIFVKAMQAANSGNALKVEQYLAQFQAMRAELVAAISGQEEQAPTDLLYLDRLVVLEREIQAALEKARGDKLLAVSLAREASVLEGEMPFSFGPPFVDFPSAEYLGELLLDTQQYAEAATSFATQLQRSRQKSNALQGLAQAQSGMGQEAEARYTREKLDRIRAGADESVKQAE
jgi:hypothetical protein